MYAAWYLAPLPAVQIHCTTLLADRSQQTPLIPTKALGVVAVPSENSDPRYAMRCDVRDAGW
jgi:hypothetical protein